MDHIYRDPHSKTYLIAGHEHSWGSFKTHGEAAAWCRHVEEEDRAFRERFAQMSKEIQAKIEADERAFREAQRARLEADRLIYGEGFNPYRLA